MSKEIPGFSWTVPSGATNLPAFRCVTMNSSGQAILPAAATDQIIGVTQNKGVAVGDAVTIVSSGISMVESAAGTLVPGDPVMTDTSGLAVDGSTAGNARIGMAVETAGAANQYIGVLLAGPLQKFAIT